ncbi:MAG: hypothetical protein F6J93_38975, partial [Oscillatoria sp. SIO1A7]|nr:hypothetical protein [Oscillatoria sp. SIO1A7]
MIAQSEPRTRVWERPSIEIQAGDVIRLDCQPIVRVVSREQLSPTQILIKVVPTNADADYRPTVWQIEAPEPQAATQNPQSSAPAKTDRTATEASEPNYLYKLKVGQLKELCKVRGLQGYSKLRQHQLIKLLQDQKLGNARFEAATSRDKITPGEKVSVSSEKNKTPDVENTPSTPGIVSCESRPIAIVCDRPTAPTEPQPQIVATWNRKLTGGETRDVQTKRAYRFLVVDEAELWQKSDLNKAKQPAIISCAPAERHQAILLGTETDLPHAAAALASAPGQNAKPNCVSIKKIQLKPAAKKPAAQTGGEQRMPIAAMSAPTVAKQSAVSPKQSAKSP